jgi:hypothetical protein
MQRRERQRKVESARNYSRAAFHKALRPPGSETRTLAVQKRYLQLRPAVIPARVFRRRPGGDARYIFTLRESMVEFLLAPFFFKYLLSEVAAKN